MATIEKLTFIRVVMGRDMLRDFHLIKKALVLVVSVAISGCGFLFGDTGYFRDRSMDYQNAKTTPDMKLSETIATYKIQPLYPIPELRVGSAADASYLPAEFKDVPRPESVLSFYEDGRLQLRRDEENDWIWVRQSKEYLLDVVEAFWRENRIALDVKNIEEGFIETVWVHQVDGEAGDNLWEKSKSGWKKLTRFRQPLQKFRVNIVNLPGENNVRILLSHATISGKKGKNYPSSSKDLEWVTRSKKGEFHRLVLQQLVDYIGSDKSRHSGLALSGDQQTRVVMNKDGNGFPVLVVELDFNRAWETVGQSLKKGKIVVDDLNRSLAIYYVGHPAKGNESESPIYEVKLSQGENGIHIAIQLDDETMAPIDVAELLLSIIESNV